MAYTKSVELAGETIVLEFRNHDDLQRVELLNQNTAPAFADIWFLVHGIGEGVLQLDYLLSLPMSKKAFERLIQHIVTGHSKYDHLVKQDILIQLLEQLDWRTRLWDWEIRLTMESILYWMNFDKYSDPRWFDIVGTMLRIWPAEHFSQLYYPLRSLYSASVGNEGRQKFWKFFVRGAALRSESIVGDWFVKEALSRHCYDGIFRAEGFRLIADIEINKLAWYIRSANATDQCALAAIEDALSFARLKSDHTRQIELQRLLSCFDRVHPDESSRRARAAAVIFLEEGEVATR